MTRNKLHHAMLPTFVCAVCFATMGGLEHEVRSQEASRKEALGEFTIDTDPRRIKEEQDRFPTGLDDFPEEIRLQLISRGIYGKDSRIDWGQIRDEKVKAIARSSVALFKEISIEKSQGGKFTILAQPLGEHSFEEANGSQLCKNERFTAQLSASFCSGVLVAEDLVGDV